MEQIISNLLSDFERGKVSRRQLIQSLAITAGAAAVAAPAAAAAPAKGFKAVALNHIAYSTVDYARTRDFYANLLGMTPSHDDGKSCFLEFGAASFMVLRNKKTPTSPTIDHIAYTIDTWDKAAVEAELKRRGHEPRLDTDNSYHIIDPDGFDVQISGRDMDPKKI